MRNPKPPKKMNKDITPYVPEKTEVDETDFSTCPHCWKCNVNHFVYAGFDSKTAYFVTICRVCGRVFIEYLFEYD